MSTYHKILAVIHPHKTEHPALHRAIYLAEKFNAELVLVSCIYDDAVDIPGATNNYHLEKMIPTMVEEQKTKLAALALQHAKNVTVTYDAIWHKKLYKGIIELANNHQCDLIVKSTKKHNSIAQRVFTPTDWKLLRFSPVNVLMVKHNEWPDNGNIVSALSLDDGDDAHHSLSDQVAKETQNIANAVNGNIHLMHTYTGAPVHISVEVPQFNPETYNADIKKKCEDKMNKLIQQYRVDHSEQHVIEGLPEDVVPSLCKQLNAQLLVLGSVGRTGIGAALLGNTAEYVIDKVNCDALVIKPNSALQSA